MPASVLAVSRSAGHAFSKKRALFVTLVAGLGVAGDAHAGVTVKHRSRVAVDPHQPNLRQVHLVQAELFDELRQKGFDIAPGDIGENITTAGIDLLGLPTGALIAIGTAVIEVTGLRNPCIQLDRFRPGLTRAVLDRDSAGRLVRKAGIMGIVRAGGTVAPGDAIGVTMPAPPFRALERV